MTLTLQIAGGIVIAHVATGTLNFCVAMFMLWLRNRDPWWWAK